MLLNNWLSSVFNCEIVKYRFLKFLFNTIDENNKNYYLESIKSMCITSNKSLIISFQHIVIIDPMLAVWVTDEPGKVLEIFQKTILELIKDIFPEYFLKFENIIIHISDLPVYDPLIDLAEMYNNTLIKIKGTVISVTNIYSNLTFFKLFCLKCLELQETIFSVLDGKKQIFTICFNCKANGPFQISNYHSVYSNFQKIILRESSNIDVYFSNLNSKQVIVKDHLVGKVKLGDEIQITGIIKYKFEYSFLFSNKIPNFSLLIDANYIENQKDFWSKSFFDLWEKKFLTKIYKNKQTLEFLFCLFKPSLVLNRHIKLALILCIFAGTLSKSKFYTKNKKNLNILIMGKHDSIRTQILDSIQQILPKSVFFSGQGVNLKSLTASLKFDNSIQDWIVEGGALVMSDKGYCVIDQIDKMETNHRKYLQEAIVQKKIFISKKGVVNFFDTRCSLIASANFNVEQNKYFCYNRNLLKHNMEQEEIELLFDLFYIIQDKFNSFENKMLADSIINDYINDHVNPNQINLKIYKNFNFDKSRFSYFNKLFNERVTRELVSKYISYTRYLIDPKLKIPEQKTIVAFYTMIRCEISLLRGIQMTIKHLEILILLIESSSRIHLRNIPNQFDVYTGISVFLKYFFEIQPCLVKKIIEIKFNSFLENKKNLYFDMLEFLLFNTKGRKKRYVKKSSFEKFCSISNIKNKEIKKFYLSKKFSLNGFKVEKNKIYLVHNRS
jgi:DNA replication licensing factor MCM2